MNHAMDHAADALRSARLAVAFTGAGISVESGLAPFRGFQGIWERHDPAMFEKAYFRRHPAESWNLIKEIFYDRIEKARPNDAHRALADMEKAGLLAAVITQNVDNLHHLAGSREVIEYHGATRILDCMQCRRKVSQESISLEILPPPCPHCGGVLKPDIVFFGEPIPQQALRRARELAETCDVMLIVGTTGEIQPACRLPVIAKNNGALLIEINIAESAFTYKQTDIFLQGKATQRLRELADKALAL